jgi:tol-pal system protein YbgF
LRTELLRNDAEQRATLAQAMKLLAAATDSLTRISARTVGIQGDVRGEMRGVKEQLLQVQTLLGQSQANINRIRSELEARAGEAAAPPPVATATPVPSTGATPPLTTPPTTGVPPADSTSRGPGPSQLYTNGLDQMKRGSTSTARTLFQELLSTYPGSDLAPAAQYWIAESLNKEKNLAGADVAFAAVVTKYGDSPEAPKALYKRALIAVQQGNTADARRLLNDVISRYPKSDEAELAADELKRIR